MYNKILAELVKKFPGLSKRFLGLVATKLAKAVTEESGIEQAITDYDNAVSITDLAADFQREGDHRVTDAKKEWDKKDPKSKSKSKTEDDDEEEEEEKEPSDKKAKKKGEDKPPSWAKKLMESVESLQTEKTQSTMKTRAAARFKGIPEKFWGKRVLPEKEDEFEAFVSEVEADWNEFKQEQVNAGLMIAEPPGGSGDGKTKTSGKEDADIMAWADKESKKADPTKK